MSEAERKAGMKINTRIFSIHGGDADEYSEFLSCLEVLHTLPSRIDHHCRSIFVPRKVEAINLFDQAQGSGKNVVLFAYS